MSRSKPPVFLPNHLGRTCAPTGMKTLILSGEREAPFPAPPPGPSGRAPPPQGRVRPRSCRRSGPEVTVTTRPHAPGLQGRRAGRTGRSTPTRAERAARQDPSGNTRFSTAAAAAGGPGGRREGGRVTPSTAGAGGYSLRPPAPGSQAVGAPGNEGETQGEEPRAQEAQGSPAGGQGPASGLAVSTGHGEQPPSMDTGALCPVQSRWSAGTQGPHPGCGSLGVGTGTAVPRGEGPQGPGQRAPQGVSGG